MPQGGDVGWIRLGRGFGDTRTKPTPEQQEAGAAGARTILESLRTRLERVPGLALRAQSILGPLGDTSVSDIEPPGVDVEDDLIDFAGGRSPRNADTATIKDHLRIESERTEALARRIADLGPAAGIARFTYLAHHAVLASRQLAGGLVGLRMGRYMTDPVAWYAEARRHDVPTLMQTALTEILTADVNLPPAMLEADLRNPARRSLLLHTSLSHTRINSTVTLVLDDLTAQDAPNLGSALFRQKPDQVVYRLLTHPVTEIASTAAVHLGLPDGHETRIPQEWRDEWRIAFLNFQGHDGNVHDDWAFDSLLERLVDQDPDLVEEWCARRLAAMKDKGYIEPLRPSGCEAHLSALPAPHRERLVRTYAALGRERLGQSLLVRLVGSNRDMVERLLTDGALTTTDILEILTAERDDTLELFGPLLLDNGTDAREPTTAAPTTGPAGAGQGATVLVSAIGGAGGIGKTWLTLAWAYRHLERFPDGQLFVDLRGFSPTDDPVQPAVAVRGFLDALGVDPNRIPADLDAQAALYRSLVAGRRMLIVLDNAATADQVAPLLPGSPSCIVLVTGRHRLASLIDRHGARHLPLDVLSPEEARGLLAARLGVDRVAAEPDAVDELIRLCGGHPLALSITARTAEPHPDIALAETAAELRDLGLEALDHDTDPAASLPTVLSWSLRHLTEQQRTVFALLGIAPGPDTTPPATAALTGLPDRLARRTLNGLENASLLERRPGGRYAMHDLIRAYATDTAYTTLPEHVRDAALTRVVDFHLHTAHTADRLLDPRRALLSPEPPAPGVHPHPLPDAAAAMAWLDAEHATLLATQRTAAALGHHHTVWHLAWNLHTFHQRRARLHDAVTTWQAALDAADHLPDPATRSRTHRNLGHAHSRLGLHEQATTHLEQALDLAVRHYDPTEQALTHRVLASAWEQQGDNRQALEHAHHALDLFHTLDLPVWEADALNAVGWFAARLGQFDTAREHCQAALTLNRHHHDPVGEADALDSLGYIAHHTGDHHQALDHYHHALTLRRGLGNAYQVADTLDRMGHPHSALGRHEQARTVWREALELYREQGRDDDAERVQQQLDEFDYFTSANPDSG